MGILAACVVSIVALLLIGGCRANEQAPIVSNDKEFEELFVPVDTIRLDKDILVGQIMFVDVSDRGELLISDYSMGRVDVFAPSGDHVRSLQTELCSPGTEFRPYHARYLEDGRVIASTGNEAFLFDSDGNCERRVESMTPPPQSFCSRGDTLFAYTPLRNRPIVRAYSSTMELLSESELAEPRFPRLTRIYRGLLGHQLACLDKGVYYIYPESSDARLVGIRGEQYRHRPAYYYAPTRDRKKGNMGTMIEDGRELRRESTMAGAVFNLDGDRRIIAFVNSPRNTGRNVFSMGLNIVSDRNENAAGVSTFIRKQPLAAKNGLLYLMGDNKLYESGNLGNPTIEVYRFILP